MSNRLCHTIVAHQHFDFNDTVQVGVYDWHPKRGQRRPGHAGTYDVQR